MNAQRCRYSRALRTLTGIALGMVLGAATLGILAPAVHAQNRDLRSLINQVDRLQRELVTLQRHVYRGEPPPASAAPAATDIGRTQAARLELRLSQFEAELRAMTGVVEEQNFRMDRLTRRLDGFVEAINLRLQALETAPGPAAGAQMTAGATAESMAPPPQPSEAQTLGAISQSALDAMRAQPVAPGGATTTLAEAPATGESFLLPEGTPKDKYDYAHSLLSQANYGGAEQALRAFLDQHPDDPLAGNAMYWLGETYYVRERFQDAAVAFAEGYKNYPDSIKAPDNLLKLGKSLAALGSTSNACGTFMVLLDRYEDAPTTVLRRARKERQKLACP